MNILRTGLVVFLVMFLAGCATSPRREGDIAGEERGLLVAPISRFEDIPVPAGFKVVKDRSFTFQTDFTRVGLLRYTGRTHIDRVADFYKEQMPIYNWDLINFFEYGKKILNFEKGNQSCIITVEASLTGTFLTIALSPKSKGKIRDLGEVK